MTKSVNDNPFFGHFNNACKKMFYNIQGAQKAYTARSLLRARIKYYFTVKVLCRHAGSAP